MPHVSKMSLDKKTRGKIFEKLILLMGSTKNHKELAMLLDELLTNTEKIMLAKRLMIILMLSDHIPQHRIAESLGVSVSTVTRYSLGEEMGKYDLIKSSLKKKRIDFEKVVWLLLTAGGILPPKIGRSYWRKKKMKALLEM